MTKKKKGSAYDVLKKFNDNNPVKGTIFHSNALGLDVHAGPYTVNDYNQILMKSVQANKDTDSGEESDNHLVWIMINFAKDEDGDALFSDDDETRDILNTQEILQFEIGQVILSDVIDSISIVNGNDEIEKLGKQ